MFYVWVNVTVTVTDALVLRPLPRAHQRVNPKSYPFVCTCKFSKI